MSLTLAVMNSRSCLVIKCYNCFIVMAAADGWMLLLGKVDPALIVTLVIDTSVCLLIGQTLELCSISLFPFLVTGVIHPIW